MLTQDVVSYLRTCCFLHIFTAPLAIFDMLKGSQAMIGPLGTRASATNLTARIATTTKKDDS